MWLHPGAENETSLKSLSADIDEQETAIMAAATNTARWHVDIILLDFMILIF